MRLSVILGLSVLALGACTTDLAAIRALKEPSGGTAFTRALALEYRDLALFEADEMYDWHDAGYFARKGLRAAKGEAFAPADPTGRDLPLATLQEIFRIRDHLMGALADSAREIDPTLAARAQARFDCWLEQQEENLQPDHIAACRDALLDSLGKLAP